MENRLEKLLTEEEIHWNRRSRNNWLANGDINRVFFHKVASKRRQHNTIRCLRDTKNNLTSDPKDMENIISEYYKALFSTQDPPQAEIRSITSLITSKFSPETKERLEIPLTKEEEEKSLFDLSPSKSPGPDGFTALFFQDAWDMVGEDVTKATLRILHDGESIEPWNSTVITLIPETKAPNTMKDYRPISLCNTTYKIVVRAITNRLKLCLGSIIDPLQSAFIPGRSITDNILL